MQQPSRPATPLSINELLDRYNQLLEGSDDKSILKGITSSAGRSKGKGIAAKLGVDTANKKSADIIYECLLKLIENKLYNLENNINNDLIDETNSLLEEHEKLLSKLTPETEDLDKAIEAFEQKLKEATDRVSEVTDEGVQKAFLSALNEFKQDNPEHLITLAIEKSRVQINKCPPNPSEWRALESALNEVINEIGLIVKAGNDEKLFINNILRAIFTGASEEGELSKELGDNLNDLNHENSCIVYSALDSIIEKLKSIYTDPQKKDKLKLFLSSPSALELFLKSEHEDENTQDKVGALKYAIPLIEKVVWGQLESLAAESDNTEMHNLEKLNEFSEKKLHLIVYDYIFSLLNDLAMYTKDRSSPELLKAVVTLSEPYTYNIPYTSNDTRIPALKRESDHIKMWIKQDSCADVVESLKKWCEDQQRLISQRNTLHALREKLSQSQDISSTYNDESNTLDNSSSEVKLTGQIQNDVTPDNSISDDILDVSLDTAGGDFFSDVHTPQKTITIEDIKIKPETNDVIVQNIMEAISSGEINVRDMAKDAMTNMIEGGFFNGNSDQSPKATTVDENVLLSEAIDETYLVQDIYDNGKFTETKGWNEELKTCIYEGYGYVDKVDQIDIKPIVAAGSLLAAMLGNKALNNEVTTEQTTPSRNVHSLWGDSNERIANVLRSIEEREERNSKLEQKNSLEQQIITENKTLSTDKSINNEVTTEQTTPSSNVHSLWGDSNERMENVLRSIEERKEKELLLERQEQQRQSMNNAFGFGSYL